MQESDRRVVFFRLYRAFGTRWPCFLLLSGGSALQLMNLAFVGLGDN